MQASKIQTRKQTNLTKKTSEEHEQQQQERRERESSTQKRKQKNKIRELKKQNSKLHSHTVL